MLLVSWERLCSARLGSVPPRSRTASSPLHLKEAVSPWQPERTCAPSPGSPMLGLGWAGLGLYVRTHERVFCAHTQKKNPTHIGGSLAAACVPPFDASLSFSRCNVCVCVCVHQVQT